MRHMEDATDLDHAPSGVGSRSQALKDDLLYGADAIANYLGITTQIAFKKLQAGVLPAGKEGRIWIASRSNLTAHYRALASGKGA